MLGQQIAQIEKDKQVPGPPGSGPEYSDEQDHEKAGLDLKLRYDTRSILYMRWSRMAGVTLIPVCNDCVRKQLPRDLTTKKNRLALGF